MAVKMNNNYGTIGISDNVLATIAGIAAMHCAGVVGMASQGAAEGIAELLKIESLKKGIKIDSSDDEISVDINIVVEYGVSMVAVADNVIDAVAYAIKSMTGFDVKAVNVNIKGVRV